MLLLPRSAALALPCNSAPPTQIRILLQTPDILAWYLNLPAPMQGAVRACEHAQSPSILPVSPPQRRELYAHMSMLLPPGVSFPEAMLRLPNPDTGRSMAAQQQVRSRSRPTHARPMPAPPAPSLLARSLQRAAGAVEQRGVLAQALGGLGVCYGQGWWTQHQVLRRYWRVTSCASSGGPPHHALPLAPAVSPSSLRPTPPPLMPPAAGPLHDPSLLCSPMLLHRPPLRAQTLQRWQSTSARGSCERARA